MSATQSARQAGFLSQLNASGESIVLPGGDVVSGLIDRGIVDRARRAGIPDFTTKSSASIEFVTPLRKPLIGQVITLVSDPAKRFRIKEAFEETGYSTRCTCEPYEVMA